MQLIILRLIIIQERLGTSPMNRLWFFLYASLDLKFLLSVSFRRIVITFWGYHRWIDNRFENLRRLECRLVTVLGMSMYATPLSCWFRSRIAPRNLFWGHGNVLFYRLNNLHRSLLFFSPSPSNPLKSLLIHVLLDDTFVRTFSLLGLLQKLFQSGLHCWTQF